MLKLIGRLLLAATGWEAVQGPPPDKKYVMIAAPHTSNWDLVYMVAFGAIYDLTFTFMTKHTLFWWPLGPVLRAVGAIPVDRRSSHDLVAQMTAAFDSVDTMILAVPAEGTRGYREYWKSGFYHIAKGAGVPIVLSQLDWSRKRAGFGPVIWPSDDMGADMDRIRAFYADKHGRHPELSGPIRLRGEEDVAENEDIGAA